MKTVLTILLLVLALAVPTVAQTTVESEPVDCDTNAQCVSDLEWCELILPDGTDVETIAYCAEQIAIHFQVVDLERLTAFDEDPPDLGFVWPESASVMIQKLTTDLLQMAFDQMSLNFETE